MLSGACDFSFRINKIFYFCIFFKKIFIKLSSKSFSFTNNYEYCIIIENINILITRIRFLFFIYLCYNGKSSKKKMLITPLKMTMHIKLRGKLLLKFYNLKLQNETLPKIWPLKIFIMNNQCFRIYNTFMFFLCVKTF